MTEDVGRITRVRIKNYKSLADVDVTLEPLTVLVGRNGSGKSNFVDALRFVQTCLTSSPASAARQHGGRSGEVIRQSQYDPIDSIEYVVDLELPNDAKAVYAFTLRTSNNAGIRASKESCQVNAHAEGTSYGYEIHEGKVIKAAPEIRTEIGTDSLTLRRLIDRHPAYRPVLETLSRIRRYSITRNRLQGVFPNATGDPDQLYEDGSNDGSVLDRLQRAPEHTALFRQYQSLCHYLSAIAPGIEPEYRSVDSSSHGSIRFKVNVGSEQPLEFRAASMSDGTLRTFALLLALYQEFTPSILMIEEPELNIHPAAAEILMEAMMSRSRRAPILTTTHSPDLLDYKYLKNEQIRIVEMVDGKTRIEPLGDITKSIVQDRLSTRGELLRIDELSSERRETDSYVEPDPELGFASPSKQRQS